MNYIYLVPLLPLFSAVLIFFFGRWLPKKGAVVGILAIGASALISLVAFAQTLLGLPCFREESWLWFRSGSISLEVGLLVDGLSLVMLLVVTIVSLLVQIYSLGYMKDDPRFKRYYAYLSLFTFSMLGLVLANNFLQLFICWELVGVCSYLLIGFWFEKKSAAEAGKKAFITTKIGDLGFYLGMFLIFAAGGTFHFGQLSLAAENGVFSAQLATWISLLIFCGAVGKSAQFPLHVWLPDAMEGPTPVSALIHAATMVAAGVYLVARCYFIFSLSGTALIVVASIGIFTAFLAATMALTANDIKQVLAYSTISQLGYMMMALGVGGYTAGIFHLTTHAFFKALLFLGAGSVIHAMHTNDLWQMGGLWEKMKLTAFTFFVAALSISGIPPFSGFYSKDEILLAAYRSGHTFIYFLATLVAGMTSFYMFRLYFLAFTGKPRNKEKYEHAHESPLSMTIPLVVLAFFSVFLGMLALVKFKYSQPAQTIFQYFVSWPGLAEEHESLPVMLVSIAVAGLGIFLAYSFYCRKWFAPERLAERLPAVYKILVNKYYLDEIYLKFVVRPLMAFAGALSHFDWRVIDSFFVDGSAWLVIKLSLIKDWIDRWIIDKTVDGLGFITVGAGKILQFTQTGQIQNYLLMIVLGLGIMVVLKIFFGM
ncbi:MAG: NADH-quinone oxidoreductase subunit L [Elusimicrobiota bacterium]